MSHVEASDAVASLKELTHVVLCRRGRAEHDGKPGFDWTPLEGARREVAAVWINPAAAPGQTVDNRAAGKLGEPSETTDVGYIMHW